MDLASWQPKNWLQKDTAWFSMHEMRKGPNRQ